MSKDNVNEEKKTSKDDKAKNNKKKREFLLNKNISSENVEDIVKAILEVNKHDDEKQEELLDYERKPISIVVDSFGGSIYDGMLLVNVIENSDTPVHTYCYGKAMSMGLTIFTVGHLRFASPTATLMYHNGSSMIAGQAEDIEQGVEQLKKIVKNMDEFIVKYTNVKKSKLDKVKKNKEDWYIFGNEALELGFVDVLLESKRELHRKNLNKNNK